MSKYSEFNTAVIHGGIYGDKYTGAVNVPIYQTSTFEQDGLGEMRAGWEYARTGNPTRQALEALIAELEAGKAGFAFASGMAAITAVLHLFHSGDKLLLSSNVYGGTFRVLDKVFNHFGLEYSLEDMSDIEDFKAKLTPEVKAVIIESPANPLLTITDIQGIAAAAHANNALVIVDNTFMTPYLQQPIKLGADIVVHSATKYLGGHSDLVAGLAVVNSEELAQQLAFIQNSTGGVLGPQDSFLLIRGIKTLSVRLDRHVENAEYLAAWLAANPQVKKVYYPGLPQHPGYDINQQQARNGGAMISFELTEEHDVNKFFKGLQLIALAESLGGVESLVCHPATMTHAAIPYEIRQKVGITDNLIRLSVGIEAKEDLLHDLQQAIEASK